MPFVAACGIPRCIECNDRPASTRDDGCKTCIDDYRAYPEADTKEGMCVSEERFRGNELFKMC